jgi:ribosome maturation factor RimP
VRKILFLFYLGLGLLSLASRAETLALTDGTSLTGDIVKFDDNGLMLRTTGDAYATVPWAKFSQDALKQLAANPKIKLLVEPFIEPDQSQRPAKPEIKVNPVTRLERPANPSLLGGLVKSSVGLFILLVLYAANLYAAFEVALIRARPIAQVVGLAAVLPVIGPIIFLAMPVKADAPPAENQAEGVAADGTAAKPQEIQIGEASWKQAVRPPEPQIFARGKFTFNKRFIESKFAGFIGEPKGEANHFSMELKTTAGQFAVTRIAQVNAADAIFETVGRGPLTVPFTDIQEIKLNPKNA